MKIHLSFLQEKLDNIYYPQKKKKSRLETLYFDTRYM